MNMSNKPQSAVTRRDFMRTTAVAGVAATVLPGSIGLAEETKKAAPKSETLVQAFHDTLTEEQKKDVSFDFDHPLRSKIDNNWHITKPRIDRFFNKDQQALIRDIFIHLHNPEYVDDVLKQVEEDNDDGMGSCSVALFGEPGSGKFEFVFTGRHVTRRCDGDSVEGAAFGGPIFYGHSPRFREEPDHPGNVYWFQAKQANLLYQALDGKQQEQALLNKARRERGNKTVELKGKREGLAGLPVSDMSADQKDLVYKVMGDLIAPFREEDGDEVMKIIKKTGIDDLHMSYYKGHDIGDDGVWDVFQIEGPSMIWYFRGWPHVHTWVNIRES
ncbi:MAG: DUF3500 domain-containing protein [Verrucomicrobiota bacterium]